MYLTAGQLAAKVSGKNWDDLVRERIFVPLGMTRTTSSITKLASQTDVSTPHARLDNKIETIPWRLIDNVAPAGSINSSVIDMAQWVRLQLGKGTFAGKQLLRPATVREMHTANTVIRGTARQDSLMPDTHLRAYGMGWFLEDYRGKLVVHHGGNIDGMSALVWMVPEAKFGLVILTNMNSTGLPNAIAHRVTDMEMGGSVRDWAGDLLEAQRAQQRAAAQQAVNALGAGGRGTRVANTKPSLTLDKYAGVYVSELYGTIELALEHDTLRVRGMGLNGPLEHWHYDTFRPTPADRMVGRPLFSFTLDAQGRPMRLTIDGLEDFVRQVGGRGGRGRQND